MKNTGKSIHQHTPGPWEVRTRRWSKRGEWMQCPAVIATDPDTEGAVWVIDGVNTGDRTDADVALIAAAPTLLGVLEAAYSRFFTHDPEEMGPEELRELENLLRAALNQARGES